MPITPKERVLLLTIEKMVFKEQDFILLGDTIRDLDSKKVKGEELKKLIVDLRLKILKELKEFFIFNLREKNSTHLEDSHEHPDIKLIEELSEKNELLEHIGQRINTVFNCLKKKEFPR